MASLDDVVSNLKNTNIALANLISAIKLVFPNVTGTATSATAGAQTLPANPAGFITVTVPGVGSVKVPYYNQ